MTTRAACLTPPGTSAVATLAVRGPDAWTVVRALFVPRSAGDKPLPDDPEVGRVWVGRFGDDIADEVILAVKATQPLPWIDIHGHGGRAVVAALLEALARRGVAVFPWPEFVRAADDDPWRAKAAEELARAPTARTAAILLDQYHGAFRRAVEANDVAGLARYAALGRHLVEPWRVVLAGAPNVGKSSLLNALAGFQRSVVSATPGTTRDVVTLTTAVDGWPVELADTAGVRAAATGLEGAGIDRARAAAASADLVLWVLDAATPPTEPPPEGALVVVNKIDLSPTWDLASVADAVRVSARTGAGLADLLTALGRRLVPDPPPPGAAVPFAPPESG